MDRQYDPAFLWVLFFSLGRWLDATVLIIQKPTTQNLSHKFERVVDLWPIWAITVRLLEFPIFGPETRNSRVWKIWCLQLNSYYKLKLIFLSGTCLLILLKYMENLEYSDQKKLRKSILSCNKEIVGDFRQKIEIRGL